MAYALRLLAVSAIVCAGILAGLTIYVTYATSPWTRDGRVRVQVANVAPQVSGLIVAMKVVDNQFVRKGDLLYAIDAFDFKAAEESAEAAVLAKTADLQVKTIQSERRQKLTDLSTSTEEKQIYAATATQASAALRDSQAKLSQAKINVHRTQVRSPVNGYVTNLLIKTGDYATTGVASLSVVDSDSFWIDGYFEETKLARICVGATAEARLMGFQHPIFGKVDTITRGISVSDAAASTQGLPNVDAVFTWVRLAQRVPVRIRITDNPGGVPLIAGLTASVSVRSPEKNGAAPSRLATALRHVRAFVFGSSATSSECQG
jgi:RND family efflux transporter MFP subunit